MRLPVSCPFTSSFSSATGFSLLILASKNRATSVYHLEFQQHFTYTLQSVFAVSCFKREFGVLWPKTNKRELDKNEKCLKKIEKRLDFLSVNSAFWGPKLIRIYSRQIRIGEYSFFILSMSSRVSLEHTKLLKSFL